jgi:hypothetical protein
MMPYLRMRCQKNYSSMLRFFKLVPEVGLEPTWALSPPDFESGAYTNFATPAYELSMIRSELTRVKDGVGLVFPFWILDFGFWIGGKKPANLLTPCFERRRSFSVKTKNQNPETKSQIPNPKSQTKVYLSIKIPGTGLSVPSPNRRAKKDPSPLRKWYQTLLDGRKTATSARPSPSKSACIGTSPVSPN